MKIKPEDLKNYIGKKIVHPNYRFLVTLLAVGDRKIFVKDAWNDEGTYYISEYLWETYEELKKKVKMWQWLIKAPDGKYYESYDFHATEHDVKIKNQASQVIRKLDWTEIEVEVDE